MNPEKGKIYYFLMNGDYARWGKVFDETEELVHCITSVDLSDIEHIPVESTDYFLEPKLRYRGNGEYLCQLEDIEEYIDCYHIFDSVAEEVEKDYGGNLEKFLRYHRLEICKSESKKFIHSDYQHRACEFITSYFKKSSIDYMIPHDKIFEHHPKLIIFDKICRAPFETKERRALSLGELLRN